MSLQRKGKYGVVWLSLAFGWSWAWAGTAPGWNCRDVEGEWVCTAPDLPRPTPPPAPPAEATGGETAESEPAVPKSRPEIRVGRVPGMLPAPPAAPLEHVPEGWTCQPDEAGGGWRCKLVGPDPDGKPHLAAVRARKPFFEPAFTAADESVFSTLLSLLPKDPWNEYCRRQRATLGGKRPPASRENLPINLEADFSQSLDENLLFFSGNVKVQRGDQRLWADSLAYDSDAAIINAWGNVIYEEGGYVFASQNAWLDLERDRGALTRTHFILGPVPARGTTERSRFENEYLSRHHEVAYTTCPAGRNDWVLHARDLRINRKSGHAVGHHVWLELMNVPFLYSPYFSYPLDDRRISGFLTPSFSVSRARGFDFSLPYYWNLAPNYDLTLTPRILSKRGFLGGVEFRYLFSHSAGRLAAELLPYDSMRNQMRGQFAFRNRSRITPHWSAFADIRYVSDDRYINEIGDSLSIASNRHLRSEAKVEYRRGDWYFLTRVENWQTVDPNISSRSQPYRRLPQMVFNYRRTLTPWLQADWESEFVFFQHRRRDDGQRLHLRPTVRLPWRTAAAFFVPSVSLDHTQYWLSEQGRTISRTLPVASLDGGLFLERAWGDALLQTLEPRLFYLYIPFDDQDDIPIFDTGLNDFNFSQLFRINRFNGKDRLNDANQLSVALTSRLLENETGSERLRATLGQIYYFRDRRVTLPGRAVETRNSSNIVAQLDFFPLRTVSWRSGLQWDPYRNRLDRGEALLQYKDTDDYIANLSYRFRRDSLEIVDGSFRWLLAPGFHTVGRFQYSLRDEIILESFLGVEAESCCWRLRLIGRRYVRDVNREADTTVFAQLELKGLLSLGRRVDRFLERNIRGYGIDD